MCGKKMYEPTRGFTLPAVCARLLEGGDEVDQDAIAGKISVDLCGECGKVARRMVRKYDTSPLPECDADAVRWTSTEMVRVLSGGDPPTDAPRRGVDRQTVAAAVSTVKAHRSGDAEHIPDTKIDAAYVTVLSLQELGILDDGELLTGRSATGE